MKIAILHEMLVKFGGAEKVLQSFLKIFPEADLYTLIYDEKKIGTHFPNKMVYKVPNITQNIYNITKNQRFCLPFMSKAVESLDFSNYDIVIASSSGFTHGAITKPDTKFIVYSHSPARYLWDWTNEYKRDIGWNKGIKGFILNHLFLNLRQWDFIASKRSDIIIANSSNTATRIQKYYKRKSEIIYPPVEGDKFKLSSSPSKERGVWVEIKDYYIIVSALTEFKRIDIAIKAFNKMKNFKLIIVGDGKYKKNLEKISNSENTIFTGFKPFDELVGLVQNSSGFIFPGEEDFGIAPIEAMFAGKPVFAYRGGGLLETNIEGKTGEFFDDKNGENFKEKFIEFDKKVKSGFYKEKDIIKNASKYSSEKFEKKIKKIIGV